MLIINRAMQCTSVDTNIITIFIVIFLGVNVSLTWGKDSSETHLTLVYEAKRNMANIEWWRQVYSTVQYSTVL